MIPIDMFSEEHEVFRAQCRRFIEKELAPYADQWEEAKDFPNEVFRRTGEAGFFGIRVPPRRDTVRRRWSDYPGRSHL